MNPEIARAIDDVCNSFDTDELRRAVSRLLYNALNNQFRTSDILSVIELMQSEDNDA